MTISEGIGFQQGIANIEAAFAAFGVPVEYGDANGLVTMNFLTPTELDITVLNATLNLHPALPGYYATDVRITPIWTSVAGAYNNVQSQLSAGNNGTNDNQLAATAAPAQSSFVLHAKSTSIGLSRIGQALVDLTTPIAVKVTTAGTGTGLTAKVKFAVSLGGLIRVADL